MSYSLWYYIRFHLKSIGINESYSTNI